MVAPGPQGQAGYGEHRGAGADRGKPGQREQYIQAEPEETLDGTEHPDTGTSVPCAGRTWGAAGGSRKESWRVRRTGPGGQAGPKGKAEDVDAESHRLATMEDPEG